MMSISLRNFSSCRNFSTSGTASLWAPLSFPHFRRDSFGSSEPREYFPVNRPLRKEQMEQLSFPLSFQHNISAKERNASKTKCAHPLSGDQGRTPRPWFLHTWNDSISDPRSSRLYSCYKGKEKSRIKQTTQNSGAFLFLCQLSAVQHIVFLLFWQEKRTRALISVEAGRLSKHV